MQDDRLSAAIRAVRIRRRWRQEDLAAAAGVSRATVSRIERGRIGGITVDVLRRIAHALDIRVDLIARWRGGELDRLVNARHSALHESVARRFEGSDGWAFAPEVSFSIYGERGIVDVLAWHAGRRTLLVVELKTAIVDVQELVGTVDRKRRLAARIGSDRGWRPAHVGVWVVVAASRTNRRRIAAHRAMLRAAFPGDGRTIAGWLHDPKAAIAALSMWPDVPDASARPLLITPMRIRRRRARVAAQPLCSLSAVDRA